MEFIIKTYLLFLIAVLYLFLGFSEKGKIKLFHILLFSIVCSSLVFQIGLHGTNVTLPIISVIAVFISLLILRISNQIVVSYTSNEKIVMLFSLIYVLGGLITTLSTHVNLINWINSCVMPFLIMNICFSLITSARQIEKAMWAASLSMIGFVLFNAFAFWTGHASQVAGHDISGEFAAEVAFGDTIAYTAWSTWIGATAAMIFPMFFLRSLIAKNLKYTLFNISGVILCLYFAYRAGTRGGAVAIVAATVFVLALSLHRLNISGFFLRRVLFLIFIFIILIFLFSSNLSTTVAGKFDDMFENKLEVANFEYRMELLYLAYSSLFTNPIGIGFDTLWEDYGIDEVNFFAWSANGVGLLGVIGFWGLWLMMAAGFIRGLSKSNLNITPYYIIGLGIMLSTFIGGNSTAQILFEPQTVLPFWLILASIYKSLSLPDSSVHEGHEWMENTLQAIGPSQESLSNANILK